MSVLQINGLTKHFGALKAVNNISLEIEPGMVYGMLGPNGSGKTTTLGMILGAIRPTAGDFSWYGQGSSPAVRKKLGAILEMPVFYPYMTGKQNLEINCRIKGVEFSRIPEVLEIVNLQDWHNHKFKGYSLGMKQRLAIASALLTDPQALVMDEPTNGLDPMGIADIRTLIQEIATMGKTILIASHLLDEIQKVCTHFCVLQKGNMIHNGSVDEDLGISQTIEVKSEDMSALQTALEAVPRLKKVLRKGTVFSLVPEEGFGASELNTYLHEKGISLSHLHVPKTSLEEKFLTILKEK